MSFTFLNGHLPTAEEACPLKEYVLLKNVYYTCIAAGGHLRGAGAHGGVHLPVEGQVVQRPRPVPQHPAEMQSIYGHAGAAVSWSSTMGWKILGGGGGLHRGLGIRL